MATPSTVISVFPNHQAAEDALKKLASAGIDIKRLSVVGKGYHTDEKVVGFYNMGDRVKFWGQYGAFWGGLWGILAGGVYVAMPAAAGVMVLGYLAATVISAIEGAAIVGGLSALGAALYSVGIPKDSIVDYESAIEADGFLVMAQGSANDVARAKIVLGPLKPSRIDAHDMAPPA